MGGFGAEQEQRPGILSFSAGARMLSSDFSTVKDSISVLAGFNVDVDEKHIYDLLNNIDKAIKSLKNPSNPDQVGLSIRQLNDSVNEVEKVFEEIIEKLNAAGKENNNQHLYRSTMGSIENNLQCIRKERNNAIDAANKKMPESREHPQNSGTHAKF